MLRSDCLCKAYASLWMAAVTSRAAEQPRSLFMENLIDWPTGRCSGGGVSFRDAAASHRRSGPGDAGEMTMFAR